jgi:N-hydroxyarylamine O-acetyltransferase
VSFDLDAYLARIAVPRTMIARANAASLDALVWGHLTHVPFENLDILLGHPIRIDLDSVFAQLVTARRGGYCYQHNTLFAAALRELGFDVVPLAARVGATRRTASRTHMLLEVHLDGRAYIADVGFGGNCPTRSIPFVLGDYPSRHGTLRLRDDGDAHYALDLDGYDTLYWFTREEQYPIDYELGNHYTSTHPGSYFVTSPRLALITDDGYRGYTDGQLTVRGAGGVVSRTAIPADHFVDMLATSFGLELPAGTRFKGVS